MDPYVIDPLTGRLVPAGAAQPSTFLERMGGGYRTAMGGGPPQHAPQPAIGPAVTGGTDMTPIRPPMTLDEEMPRPNVIGPASTGGTDLTPVPVPPMDAADLGAFNAPAPEQPPERALGVLANAGGELPVPASANDGQPIPLPPPSPPRAPPGQAAPQPPQGALSGAPLMAPPLSPGNDDIDAFGQLLMNPESGGRPDVVNRGGYAGLFQFGAPRLQTLGLYTPGPNEQMRGWGGRGGAAATPGQWTGTFNIPGFENVRTLQDFLNNPEAQRAALRTHVRDIDQTIDSTPGAEAFNRNGLRGAAHIGGNGGMQAVIAGQAGAVDANGQGPASYYRRFAGSDAPPGAGGMAGRATNDIQAAAPTMQSVAEKPPPAAPQTGLGQPNSRDFLAGNWQALLAAGAGMMSGRNMMDGMARAGAGFVSQTNQDRTFEQGRLDRQEARADRRQSQAELAAHRRAQLGIAQQRADQAGVGRNAAAGNVQSTARVQDTETGTTYLQTTFRDGRTSVRTLDGQDVTDQAVIGRLRQGNDPGSVAENRDLIARRNEVYEQGAAARALRPAITNARRVLQEDPNITGPDWGTRGANYIAESLGIPVGQRTPENIAMLRQALQTGNMQTLMQIAPSLRPMSNVDLQAIREMSPSLLTNPRIIGQWLDQLEHAAGRAERMSADLAARLEDPAQARAIMRSGGIGSWRQRWEAEDAARNPRPTAQPGTNARGQREWQSTTPTGVGYTFNR